MRTLTTGAAALLTATIVGVLALTGAASAHESAPPTPDDLKAAQTAFIAAVDAADADVDLPEAGRANGRIVINGVPGPDSLERALEWLEWQEGRAKAALPTLAALPEARHLKAAMDATEEACIAAFGVCAWDNPEAVDDDPVDVRVRVVRSSVSSWSIRIEEVGPRGGVYRGDEATVEPTTTARVIADSAYTLSNGARVAVVVDLKRDKRVEFAILADSNRDGRFNRSDNIALPDLRFVPGNARFGQPLRSSTVSIAYTPTEWWLQGDGS